MHYDKPNASSADVACTNDLDGIFGALNQSTQC